MKYYIQFSYSYDLIITEAFETIDEVQDKIMEIKRSGMDIDAIFYGDNIYEEVMENLND